MAPPDSPLTKGGEEGVSRALYCKLIVKRVSHTVVIRETVLFGGGGFQSNAVRSLQ